MKYGYKIVMQTDDNLYTYYFVLQVYTCKALLFFIIKNS
jgi:hypothetical protein